MTEKVNHPDHYNAGTIEVIDFIEAVTARYPAKIRFHLGNVLKYVPRAPLKNGGEDINKALWYAKRSSKQLFAPTERPSAVYYVIDVDKFIQETTALYHKHWGVAPALTVDLLLRAVAFSEDSVVEILDEVILRLEKLAPDTEL